MSEVKRSNPEMSQTITPSGTFDRHDRFTKMWRAMCDLMFHSVDVVHEHRVAEMPNEQRVVFATSHLTDFDEQAVAAALSPYRTLDMSSLATNLVDPVQKNIVKLVGRDRFHGLANIFDKKNNEPATGFNPANFDSMRAAMATGHDMIFSAHNPAREGMLPDRSGIGAVYLAHLTGTPIMPVAVDIHADSSYGMAAEIGNTIKTMIKGRPDVSVIVGEPIQLEPIDPDRLKDISLIGTKKFLEIKESDPVRYKEIKDAHAKLKQQSALVMYAIAEMLPPKKRGKWAVPEHLTP